METAEGLTGLSNPLFDLVDACSGTGFILIAPRGAPDPNRANDFFALFNHDPTRPEQHPSRRLEVWLLGKKFAKLPTCVETKDRRGKRYSSKGLRIGGVVVCTPAPSPRSVAMRTPSGSITVAETL